MKEIIDIVSTIKKYGNDCKAVLATVVKIKGSTYRRPGARMLITKQGDMVGGISGGCLEEDVREKAQEVFLHKKASIITYDMMSDDDIVWGLGLGCNGLIHVLLEYVEEIPVELQFVLSNYYHDKDSFVITIFENNNVPDFKVGDKYTSTSPCNETTDVWKKIVAFAPESIHKKKVSVIEMPFANGYISLLIEPIKATSLSIFGAGFDAFPLVDFAKKLGWKINLYDYREAYLVKSRFADADEMIELKVGQVDQILEDKKVDMAIIMTHNFQHDVEILRALLQKEPLYIGMLGPAIRKEKIIAEIEKQGDTISEKQMNSIYGPVGLDIGSEIPEEIAIAIISEMLAVKNARNGNFLRNYDGSIH